MLFNKFIVAFVTAITLATSVAAAATPSPNGTGQNTGSPSQDKSQLEDKTQGSVQGSNQSSSKAPTCSPGLNPMCCDAIKPFSSLSDSFKTSLKSLDANLDQNGKVGQNCVPPVGSQGCGTQLPLCCDAVQSSDGLPDLAPNCVSPTN